MKKFITVGPDFKKLNLDPKEATYEHKNSLDFFRLCSNAGQSESSLLAYVLRLNIMLGKIFCRHYFEIFVIPRIFHTG